MTCAGETRTQLGKDGEESCWQKYLIDHVYRDRFQDIPIPSFVTHFMPHHITEEWILKIFKSEEAGNHEAAAKLFVDGVLECWKEGSFVALIGALEQAENEVLCQLLKNDDVFNYDCFRILVSLNMKQICETVQLDVNAGLMLDLKQLCLTESQYERVRKVCEKQGNTAAVNVLVTDLFISRTKPNSPMKFLDILKKNGCDLMYDELTKFIGKDDTDHSAKLDKWEMLQTEKSRNAEPESDQHIDTSCGETLSVDVAGENSEETQRKSLYDSPYEAEATHIDTPQNANNVATPDEEEDPVQIKQLELRAQQTRLAEYGNSGKNVIIVAPTNFGKTYVALDMCKKHLKRNEQNKLIFFVPRVPLISQQHKRFREYLSEFKSIGMCGEAGDHGPFHLLLPKYRILVMTPQILLNAMKDENRMETKVSIDMFSMLVFDECHHTDKGHAYNEIMSLYMHEKLIKQANYLPQIIGLTASPGTNKSNTMEKAVEHIMRMCANLDSIMVCPNSNAENLQNDEIKTELRTVTPRKHDIFQQRITDVMIRIESKINTFAGVNNETASKIPEYINLLRSCPAAKNDCQYTGWISQMKKIIPKLQNPLLNDCVQYLMHYHDSLLLNDKCRSRDALNDLEKHLPLKLLDMPMETHRFLEQSYKGLHEELHSKVDEECYTNPLMKLLKDLLTKSYSQYQSECRAIVFVKTRELARILEEWMNEDGQLKQLNAAFMVGQEMTKTKQEEVLNNFSNGDHKVLIATTVAEEGLDVKQCSLVICYNHVTNEIAMVQTRGRARKEGSKYIVIAVEDKITAKGELNELREQIMHVAIKFITRKYERNEEQFKTDLERLQTRELKQKQLSLEKKPKKQEDPFKVTCINCFTDVCESVDFRKIASGFTIISDHINKRYKRRAAKSKTYCNIEERGKIECAACGLLWGSLNIYCERVYPFFKIENFALTNLRTGETSPRIKKWKDSPFAVEPVGDEDIDNMINKSTISPEELRRLNP
ncbi:ATP-dependent RNA helicase DHX58-like [Tubulanus polymorphus]|uniref:ATP-dependent RNA helicase DHX58-like n=1 Tax=Tubulanus polymorphus TaxID=672921 RepID=UPI003DA6976F